MKFLQLLKMPAKKQNFQNTLPEAWQNWRFWAYIPTEYGGAGLDQISYGLIMQELERGDSGIRSTSRFNLPCDVSYMEIW